MRKTKPTGVEGEKDQEMKARMTIVAAAFAICVPAAACASEAAPPPNPPGDSSAAPGRDLPAEVREFLDRRYECNHVITAERSRQFRCRELLTDEAVLKRQYSSDETVLKALERPLFQRLIASD